MQLQHKGLPVKGYHDQSATMIDMVNTNKELEERVLRQLDALEEEMLGDPLRERWFEIARNNLEQGFMAMNRAVFAPTRISLPEDEA